jgi:3-oxoacyl-[acyl-carrier-protein] synthase II
MLGAAGAFEAIVSALSLKHGAVPPTINLDEPDPECDLDYVPHAARELSHRVAVSNSFGFGGQNAALVFKSV